MTVRYRKSIEAPDIYIDMGAFEDMLFIARAVNVEVAWFCEVTPGPTPGSLVVGAVHVPFQQSSSATVEIEPNDLFKFADEFIRDHGAEKYNTIRAWGHSHHKMGVSPSGQDQKMLDTMIDTNGAEFMIAIRINHAGDMQVDYATKQGITFENTAYILGSEPEVERWWEEVVKDRLRPMPSYQKGKTTVYKTYPTPQTNYPQVYGDWPADWGGQPLTQPTKKPALPPIPKALEEFDFEDDEFLTVVPHNAIERARWMAMVPDRVFADDIDLIIVSEEGDAIMVIEEILVAAIRDANLNPSLFPPEEMVVYAREKYERLINLNIDQFMSMTEGLTDDAT